MSAGGRFGAVCVRGAVLAVLALGLGACGEPKGGVPPGLGALEHAPDGLVARIDADLRAFGRVEDGTAFLGRDASGELLAVTARWYLTRDAGLADEIRIPYLEAATARFELVSGDGTRRTTVRGRARAGLDAAACDVLVLRADDSAAPASKVLELTDSVPEVGDALAVAVGGAEPALVPSKVDWIGGAARISFEVPRRAEPTRLIGSPVLDADGRAYACVVSVDWSGETAATSPSFDIEAQLLRPFLRSPAPLVGEPFVYDDPGLDTAVFDTTGTLMFLSNPVLGGAKLLRWPSLDEIAGPNLPRGQGAGGFTSTGWLVTAGRGGRFSLFDPLSGHAVVEGEVPLPLVGAVEVLPGDMVLMGSPLIGTSVLVDASSGEVRQTVDAWGASIERSPDGATLAFGGGDGSLALVDVVGLVPHPLDPHDEEVSALAFSPDSALLASGSWGGRILVHDVKSRELVRELPNVGSDVNDLAFVGELLVVATGSTEDGPNGREPTACFVRVFDPRTGREVARSHDHASPRLALLPLPTGEDGVRRLVGLGIGTEQFAWVVPVE
ncbi:MAG: hypothetical protein R3F34_09590 [Planctomycetota bacterium]